LKKSLALWLTLFWLISCHSDTFSESETLYEFIKSYTTTITVGGFVGVTERTFELGEVYFGTVVDAGHISIRIATHSKQNEDCPNPWCYQEFLEVPREYLRVLP
jgi:hypothetical protein